jgi:hypothetical protein
MLLTGAPFEKSANSPNVPVNDAPAIIGFDEVPLYLLQRARTERIAEDTPKKFPQGAQRLADVVQFFGVRLVVILSEHQVDVDQL